jgi:GNAT superfamily N-acetyltransferase
MSDDHIYDVRHRLSPAQTDELLRLYADEWWSAGRTAPDVARMLRSSDLLFAVVERRSDTLVAFARVLTDNTYLALVLDVIVAPAHRERGLGRLLMESVCSHRTLRAVTSIELVCQPELVPFYRKWGFSERVGRSQLLRRTTHPALAP